MKPDIKRNLDTLLHPGETVVWHSATKPFGILDGREGNSVRLQWIISTVCVLAFLGLVVAYGNPRPIVIGILLLLLAILILAPVASYRLICSQEYVITNERAMIVKPGVGAYAINRAELDDCQLMKLSHPGEALAIGGSLRPEGNRQLRWRSLHPKLGRYAKSSDGLTYAEGIVFYNISDGSQAAQLLRNS